jgi:hypothetical protein
MYSAYVLDAVDCLPRTGIGTLLLVCIPQLLPEPIDLSQTLLDHLQWSRCMFGVVLDGRLQVVDRRRDGLRPLSEAQRSELLRVSLMSPSN